MAQPGRRRVRRRRAGARASPSPTRSSSPTTSRRAFGGIRAVDVDHLEVQRGAITALIGPNGAGKTTLFNLLTGFDKPDSGTWTFDGQTVERQPSYKLAPKGMVRTFQLTKVLANMSVLDNMMLAAQEQSGESMFRPASFARVERPGARVEAPGPRAARALQHGAHEATSSPARSRAGSASCSRWRGR